MPYDGQIENFVVESDDLKVLRRARELVARRGGWTRYFLARLLGGRPADPNDPAAHSFCTLGALQRASAEVLSSYWHSSSNSRLCLKVARAAGLWSDDSLPAWNDSWDRRKGQVVEVFDKAIAAEVEALVSST